MALSLATAVLAAVGLTSSAVPLPSAAAQLLWWPAPGTAPTLTEGVVASTAGGWDRTTSPQARVVAVAGPETTLHDLASVVHSWLSAIATPQHPVPDAAAVGRALLAYHADDLDLAAVVGTGQAVSSTPFPAWQGGRAVPLPIEFDASATAPTFVTDLLLWQQLADSLGAGVDALLDYLPTPLLLPDFDADEAEANARLASAATPAELSPAVRTALLTNPAAEVYRTLALLRSVDATPNSDRLTFLTRLVTTDFTAAELAFLAALRPGAVVLRALYRRLAANPSDTDVDAALAALRTAFGFPSAAASIDLGTTAPPVAAQELPVSTAWRMRPDTSRPSFDATGERTDGRHEIVLGRAVYCGTVTTETWAGISYRGPSSPGRPAFSASAFLTAHAAELNPDNDPKLAARLAAVTVIAPSEGNLDAVRLRDGAILALGIQQWSADSDTELTLLLWQLHEQYPDEFDAHFRLYGLELTLVSSYADGTPKQVAMASVTTTGRSPMPARAAHGPLPPERLAFFGGFSIDTKTVTFVDPHDETALSPWAARVRNAELCSRGLQRLQLLEAARRFTKIAGENRTWNVGTASCTIDKLITSAQGAAQLLDQHVNNPKLTAQSITAAVAAVTTPPGLDGNGNPNDAWRTAFEGAYLDAVAYPNNVPKHDVRSPSGKLLMRGRQDRILAAGLSPAPRSFGGW